MGWSVLSPRTSECDLTGNWVFTQAIKLMCTLVYVFSQHPWYLYKKRTVTYQGPWSGGFSSQKDWSGLPFPPPGDLPNPEGWTQVSCIEGRFFTSWATREAPNPLLLVSLWKEAIWARDTEEAAVKTQGEAEEGGLRGNHPRLQNPETHLCGSHRLRHFVSAAPCKLTLDRAHVLDGAPRWHSAGTSGGTWQGWSSSPGKQPQLQGNRAAVGMSGLPSLGSWLFGSWLRLGGR